MATITAAAGSTNWTTAAFGAQAATTAADDVIIPTGASVTITASNNVLCRSLSVTGTGTIIFAATTSQVSIGTSTPGTGNVALSIASGATVTLTAQGTINFVSTSATVQTITTNGKTLPNIAFNGAGGSWQNADNMIATGTGNAGITLTTGTWDSNGKTISMASFSSSNSLARSLICGTSTINVTTGNWLSPNATNMSVSASSATINMQGASGVFQHATSAGGPHTFGTIQWVGAGTGVSFIVSGSCTINTLTRTGTAVKTDAFIITPGNFSIGTLNLSGNSTTNRIIVASATRGTTAILPVANLGTIQNVDFMDICLVNLAGTIITSDSFNRANGALAGSTSDAAGGGSGLVWGADAAGSSLISSNQIVGGSGNTRSGGVNLGTADQYLTAKVGYVGAANGLLARFTNNANFVYAVVLNATSVYVGYLIGGVETILTSTTGVNFNSGDTLGLIVKGNTVVVLQNGVVTYTKVLPSNIPAGTRASMQTQLTGYVDDFKAYNVPDIDLSAITGLSGDCGGNTGITFTAPAAQTNTSAAGNWSDASKWTSRVPLPQDDVAFSSGSGAVSIDMPRMGKSINFTNYSGTATWASSLAQECYGSFTLSPGMTVALGNTVAMSFAGRGNHTFTMAGKTFTYINGGMTFNGPGGTYTLQDAVSTNGQISVNSGTFTQNTQTITCQAFNSNSAVARTCNLDSTINITAIGSTLVNFAATALVLNATSSNFVITSPVGSARIFTGAGLAYGTLTYTVANSPGTLTITGNNSFNTLNIGAGRTLSLTAGNTQTVSNWIGSGAVNNYQRLPGVASNYISTPDSIPLSITGDIELVVRVALDDWTPVSSQALIYKWGASGQQSYGMVAAPTGLTFFMSSTGSNSLPSTTISHSFVDGTTYWIKMTRVQSTGTVGMYWAADSPTEPSSWTTLNTQVVSAGTAIFDSNAPVEIGTNQIGAGVLAVGKFYRAIIRSGIGGTKQFDADFTTKAFGANTFTESSANAATVTITGAAAQAGDGRLSIVSGNPGTKAFLSKPSGGPLTTTADFLSVQDIAVVQPLSFFAGANSISVSGNSGVHFIAPGTYRHRQSVAATASATSVSVTLPAATTAGNLLVAYIHTAGASGGSQVFPSGFSSAVSSTQSAINYIYYKIATGSETTLSYSQATLRNLVLEVVEYSGFTGTPTLDVTDNNNSAASVTTLSTTASTGPANTAQPALALAIWGAAASFGATTALTNSFAEDYTYYNATAIVKAAAKELTTTAAVNTAITWSSARPNVVTAIAVFKGTAPLTNGNFFPFFS